MVSTYADAEQIMGIAVVIILQYRALVVAYIVIRSLSRIATTKFASSTIMRKPVWILLRLCTGQTNCGLCKDKTEVNEIDLANAKRNKYNPYHAVEQTTDAGTDLVQLRFFDIELMHQ